MQSFVPLVSRELGDLSSVDILVSLSAVKSWQAKQRPVQFIPGRPTPLDAALLMTANRFLQFAAGAYGWKGLVFFHATDPRASYTLDGIGGLLSDAAMGDAASFCRQAHISREELLFMSSGAAIGVPKHYIALDSLSRAVVLVIRGSMSVSDCLTDVVTDSEEFCGGEAHRGIAHAARVIFESTRSILSSALAARPGWRLVVTGHSLGAGTAILYTVLTLQARLKDHRDGTETSICNKCDVSSGCCSDASHHFSTVPISCHAFAPPPLFFPLSALSPEVHSAITCWVHGDDLVPRLSIDRCVFVLTVLLLYFVRLQCVWQCCCFCSVRDLVRVLRKVSSFYRAEKAASGGTTMPAVEVRCCTMQFACMRSSPAPLLRCSFAVGRSSLKERLLRSPNGRCPGLATVRSTTPPRHPRRLLSLPFFGTLRSRRCLSSPRGSSGR
jgi:hypothetical protein